MQFETFAKVFEAVINHYSNMGYSHFTDFVNFLNHTSNITGFDLNMDNLPHILTWYKDPAKNMNNYEIIRNIKINDIYNNEDLIVCDIPYQGTFYVRILNEIEMFEKKSGGRGQKKVFKLLEYRSPFTDIERYIEEVLEHITE